MCWNKEISTWYVEYLKQVTEEQIVSEYMNRNKGKSPSPHTVRIMVEDKLGIKHVS